MSNIRKDLVYQISTLHIPKSILTFGKYMFMKYITGYYVYVDAPSSKDPDWLKPIMEDAYNSNCTFIDFSEDAPILNKYEVYE